MLNMLNNWTDGLNSTTALDQFEKETYTYDLIGKIVNLGDDIDDTYIEKSRVIKVIAGGVRLKQEHYTLCLWILRVQQH